MKKTCYHCQYFHHILESPYPEDFFHLHNYCEKLKIELDLKMNSYICNFLDENLFDNEKDSDISGYIFDDCEVGAASCYLFAPITEEDYDEEMKNRFELNKELALKLVDWLIKVNPEHADEFEGYKEKILKSTFEDQL